MTRNAKDKAPVFDEIFKMKARTIKIFQGFPESFKNFSRLIPENLRLQKFNEIIPLKAHKFRFNA